jgi:hypothetical protein
MAYVGDLEEDEEFVEAEDETYPVTRLLLAPEYRDLPDDQIETILAAAFPGMEAEDAESFLGDVGRAFSRVGREVVRRGPDILGGAARGFQTGLGTGGLYGGLIGAGAGALVGGLTGGRPPPGPARPGVPPPGVPPPSALPPGVPAPGVPLPGVLPGAGLPSGVPGEVPPAGVAPGQQLAAMLAQPQTWQAALTSLFGPAGRQTLPAGGGQVPVSSVLAGLGTFATRTAEELAVGGDEAEAAPGYLMDAEGNYAVDPANPDARAEHLLGVLGEANMLESVAEYDEGEDYEYDEGEEYEYDEGDDD